MAISVLAAALLQAAQPQPADVLGLLDGEWVCRVAWRGGPMWRSETWERDAQGRLTGVIVTRRTTAGPPERRQEAELTISGHGRGTRLTYRADGRTSRYRLVRNDRMEAVFEIIGSGSPRIISYRDSGFRQLEVMHGLATGSSERWLYQPQGMHLPTGMCNGSRR